jgi:L-threonylcarbamoyladenylate synthase
MIVRPGPITPALILAKTGLKIGFAEIPTTSDSAIISPGLMTSHYAPNATIRLNATSARDDELFIGFGVPPDGVTPDLSLSQTGDLTEACALLFSLLHDADSRTRHIAIAPVPMADLGIAINDRLMRAAAERP